MVHGSMETTTMIRPADIGSLTDFSRNTKAHLKRLKRTGRPELLTVNGKAEVVVQSASAYQLLIESLEKLKRDSQGRIRRGQDDRI
jgi:prevent-host-death family protein